MALNTEIETRREKWKKILVHELVEYLINMAFLSFFLVSFAWYHRLILASYDIHYTDYLGPLIEAAVLAKIIMIGDILRLGRRFRNLPLIVPAIYRTMMFSLLVVMLTVLEHLVKALIHGKKVPEWIAEITANGWSVWLAWYVLIIVALLPFFTMKELERVFGPEKIRGLFFRGNKEEAPSDGKAEIKKQSPDK